MLNSSRFCILKDRREWGQRWAGLWGAVRVCYHADIPSHCPLLPQTAWCMGSLRKENSFPYPAPPLREILSGGGREKEEKIINITKQVLQNILRSRLPVSASSTIVCEFKKQNTFFYSKLNDAHQLFCYYYESTYKPSLSIFFSSNKVSWLILAISLLYENQKTSAQFLYSLPKRGGDHRIC